MDTSKQNQKDGEIIIVDDIDAIPNPFVKLSRVARSPTTKTPTRAPTPTSGAPPTPSNGATMPKKNGAPPPPPLTPTGAPPPTPTGAPSAARTEIPHHRPEFLAMGAAIAELEKDMIDENRRSLTQAMKIAFRKLRSNYLTLAKEPPAKSGNACKDDTTQTTPLTFAAAAKRRNTDEKKPMPSSKRPKEVTRLTKPAGTLRSTDTPRRPTLPATSKENEWQKVARKKPKKKAEKRPRPDAIIIKAKEGTSYADILRKVKADESLKPVGEAVARVRRTAGGDLLLQLRGTGGQTANLRDTISNSLGAEIEVRAVSQRTLIEIRHIDEVTTGDDVLEAVKALPTMDGIPLEATIHMRKAFGSTQIATLSLPAELAKKLLLLGKAKIGWTVCPIREKRELMKCFKCLEYGHIAKLCRNEDRSKLCRRCGKADHIAKDCINEPACMFCIKNNAKETGHIAGSGRCPILKKALDNRK